MTMICDLCKKVVDPLEVPFEPRQPLLPVQSCSWLQPTPAGCALKILTVEGALLFAGWAKHPRISRKRAEAGQPALDRLRLNLLSDGPCRRQLL